MYLHFKSNLVSAKPGLESGPPFGLFGSCPDEVRQFDSLIQQAKATKTCKNLSWPLFLNSASPLEPPLRASYST